MPPPKKSNENTPTPSGHSNAKNGGIAKHRGACPELPTPYELCKLAIAVSAVRSGSKLPDLDLVDALKIWLKAQQLVERVSMVASAEGGITFLSQVWAGSKEGEAALDKWPEQRTYTQAEILAALDIKSPATYKKLLRYAGIDSEWERGFADEMASNPERAAKNITFLRAKKKEKKAEEAARGRGAAPPKKKSTYRKIIHPSSLNAPTSPGWRPWHSLIKG